MAFLGCHDPLMTGTDWSACFRRNFLNTLLPLVAVGLSLILCIVQLISRSARARRSALRVARLDPAASNFHGVNQEADSHPAHSRSSRPGLLARALFKLLPWTAPKLIPSLSSDARYQRLPASAAEATNGSHKDAAQLSSAALSVYHTENAVILNEVHDTLSLDSAEPREGLFRLEVVKRAWEAVGCVLLAGLHAAGTTLTTRSRWEWAWVALWSYLGVLSAFALSNKHSFFMHKLFLMSLAAVVAISNFRSAMIATTAHRPAVIALAAAQLAMTLIVSIPTFFFPMSTKTPRRLRAVMQTMKARKVYGEARTVIPSPHRPASLIDVGADEEAGGRAPHQDSQPIASISTIKGGINGPSGLADSSAPMRPANDNRPEPNEKSPGLLIPAPEARASIFSRTFFNFVTPFLVKHSKIQFTLPAVPDLPGPDRAACVVADFRASSSARKARSSTSTAWDAAAVADEEAAGGVSEEGLMPSDRPLVLRLIKYFAPLLLLQCIFAFGEAVLTLTPAIGLRWVLAYIAERDEAKLATGRDDAQPATPFHMAVLFAVFMALGQLLASICSGQALIVGRRICIRLRAILIFEIINKALRRKDTGSASAAKKAAETLPDAGASRVKPDGTASPAQASTKKDDEAKPEGEEEQGRASDGEVTNLVSVDVFKVSEIGAYLHYAFPSAPVQIAVCVFLLVRMLGSAAVAGFGVLFLSFPVQMLTARLFIKIQKLSLEATDQRLNLTTEVLNCIKTVKFFAWEKSFEERLDQTRQKELKILRYRFIAWLLNAVTYFGVPMIVTLVTFAFHTKVLHRPLRAETAFTALALLNALRRPLDMLPDMIVNILSSLVSIRRIDAYLREEETAKYEQLLGGEERVEGDPVVGFQDATFTYTEGADDEEAPAQTFSLRDLNLTFPTGELSVIAGPVGSGKTTLLMSLLGETRQLGGRTFMPCAVARALLETDPVTGLSESVAYCSQSPWLLGATVKENILFGMPYEERRYKAVVKACALEPDLKILEYGDETEVGEKGTSLSGGQKARLALARALYSPAKYLLIDDALSAVDAHTAKHLFRQYFKGSLMQGRTCILVTHAVSLCLPGAAYVVALNEGAVVAAGSPEAVRATGIFDEDLASSKAPSKANSVDGDAEEAEDTIEEVLDEGARAAEQAEIKKKQDKKAAHSNEETYSAGGISMKAYALYLRSFATTKLGLAAFYLLCVIVFIGSRLMDVSTAAWLRRWVGLYALGGGGGGGDAQAPVDEAAAHQAVVVAALRAPVMAAAHASSFVRSSTPTTALASFATLTEPIQRLLSPPISNAAEARGSLVFADSSSNIASILEGPTSDQTAFYLGVYAVLVVVYLIFCVLRDGVTLWGSLVASRVLYRKLMKSIIMATPQWFDRTPVGRIMNRLSKDIETVDQDLAPQLLFFFDVSIQSIVIVIVSCYAMPAFFPASLLVIAAYWSIGALYIVSSRDLKRIESVTRSPIFTLVGEVLSGSVLIRAYGDASRFTRHCLRLIDRTNRPFFFLWYENRWLSIRVETVATAVTLSMALFLVSRNSVDAALAGFTLSFTTQLVDSVLWVLRCYTMVEINGNSVERIAEYLEIPSEKREGQEPPAAWPSAKATIEVQDLAVRYTPEFPRVLDGISFKVAPGEKVGIVGRTGSGKSTLALSFFRFLEAEQGKIVIDGIDISTVPLATLRDRLTVIPQDAQLFSGTIRSNLDPFGRCEDAELWAALQRCQLAARNVTPGASRVPSAAASPAGSDDEGEEASEGSTSEGPTTAVITSLDMVVEQNGRNFSAGQKQLLALARGLLKLRSSSILILDESTANLDTASDNHMQRTIRSQMASATILTIAHRLRTIGDYDKVLTLGNGQVLEFDSPANLLRKEGSVYRELAERSGEWDTLLQLAEEAERKGKGKSAVGNGKERD